MPKRRSVFGEFFGVAADSRTWGALFYMLLALGTGIFYFTWAVTGISLSLSLSVLIIGIPFAILFLGTVRALSLLEGRIVETMLGVRMPRRPPYPTNTGKSFGQRVGAFFTDLHTWTTLFYMILMLPLGILYFTLTITFLSISLGFISTPILKALSVADVINLQCGIPHWLCDDNYWPLAILTCIGGVLMLFVTLHMVRGLGKLHGAIAKGLLVRMVGEGN
jgi:hypothetical protein